MRTPFAQIMLLSALAAAAASCGNDDDGDTVPRAAPAEESRAAPASTGAPFPVTVRSCDQEVTFEQAPQRAVVNDNNMVELMFELGLADRMVGYAGVGQNRNILPQLARRLRRRPVPR